MLEGNFQETLICQHYVPEWEYLARTGDFFAVKAQMIRIRNHVSEHKDSLGNERFIVFACPRKGFYEPECAHGKGSFTAADSVFSKQMIV